MQMDKNELSRIADLAAGDGAPQASMLTPDVRSGSSFTYEGDWDRVVPAFLVVWFYTVKPDKRVDFADKVKAYETSESAPVPEWHFLSRHLLGEHISTASPEFEYRTVWGLRTLRKDPAAQRPLARAAGAPTGGVIELILSAAGDALGDNGSYKKLCGYRIKRPAPPKRELMCHQWTRAPPEQVDADAVSTFLSTSWQFMTVWPMQQARRPREPARSEGMAISDCLEKGTPKLQIRY